MYTVEISRWLLIGVPATVQTALLLSSGLWTNQRVSFLDDSFVSSARLVRTRKMFLPTHPAAPTLWKSRHQDTTYTLISTTRAIIEEKHTEGTRGIAVSFTSTSWCVQPQQSLTRADDQGFLGLARLIFTKGQDGDKNS